MVNVLRLKLKGWFKKLLPFLLVLLIITAVDAKDVTLSWDPSPTPEVTGYTLYWSTNPLIPESDRISVDSGDVLTHFVANLPDDEHHWFAVTAHDDLGNESTYSNIVDSPSTSLPDLDFFIEWNIITEGDE